MQANVVQPLESQNPLMHFWPLIEFGQSESAQHSAQTLGLDGQYLPTIEIEKLPLVYVSLQKGLA